MHLVLSNMDYVGFTLHVDLCNSLSASYAQAIPCVRIEHIIKINLRTFTLEVVVVRAGAAK